MMTECTLNENEEKRFEVNDLDTQDNDDENNFKNFGLLLMQENINYVAKMKRYKSIDFRKKLVLSQLKELKKLSELSKIWVSVPYNEQTFYHPVISVDSSKSGSNLDVLRLAINDLGWREYPNGRAQKPCHVVWNSSSFNDNKSSSGAFVNKFPGISQCLHKVGFTRILETMRILFPEHYSFYPQTWYLPHQMVDFVIYCKLKESENKKEKYYIVKPDAGTQGEGIYLIRRPQDYKTSSRSHVVQEYLADPLLIDGYKFDLRIYVVLLSLDPLKVYLCKEGLARFCTHKYFLPTTTNHGNTFMHLTNYSLNKKSTQFIHNQNLDSGSKRTMSSVFAAMELSGFDVASLWKRLEELVYKTVLAMVPQLKVHYVTEILGKTEDITVKDEAIIIENRSKCFQILGFDVLIMEDLQPLLLEVNSNPSLRLDCEMEIAPGICEYYLSKVDIVIKRPLVKDTLKLLEKDISDKFNIDIKRDANSDLKQRAHDVFPLTKENPTEIPPGDASDKENFDDIVTEWNMDSEFGPFFLEIAKENKILPQGVPLSRSTSLNDLIADNDCSHKGMSPQIRQEQEERKRERLAKEKSWLNLHDEKKGNPRKSASAVSKGKGVIMVPESSPEEESCLQLISPEEHRSIYDKLRLLEDTTVIFFHAMGHRYTGNMGATAFRTFGRRCKLQLLGFNHAMIDLIYIEIQRRWAFLTNYESKQGLCYQAFLEAFFRIAFAKFGNLSKKDAIEALIEHCKSNIGRDNLNCSSFRTLFPSMETRLSEKAPIRTTPINKDIVQFLPPSSLSAKSLSSESTDSSSARKSKKSTQSKYDLMKAIHQIYRRKLLIPKSSLLEEMGNSDSDSGKSLPTIGNIKTKKPIIIKPLHEPKGARTNDRNQSPFKKYRYDSPLRSTRLKEDSSGGSVTKNSESELPVKRNSSPERRTMVTRGGTIISEVRPTTDLVSKLYAINKRSDGGKQWLPMNNERMMKIISAYGDRQLLRSSSDGIRRKNGHLKPI